MQSLFSDIGLPMGFSGGSLGLTQPGQTQSNRCKGSDDGDDGEDGCDFPVPPLYAVVLFLLGVPALAWGLLCDEANFWFFGLGYAFGAIGLGCLLADWAFVGFWPL